MDGRLEISNNHAERSIKPFVIDRKNFLFANTPGGAKASAVTFSIIESAKENGLTPYAYLTYIFRNAPNRDVRNNPEALTKLLPGNAPNYYWPVLRRLYACHDQGWVDAYKLTMGSAKELE